MSRFKYKPTKDGEAVYLDGKRVGTIKKVLNGFAYFTKGGKPGETFSSRQSVKDSIEGE